MFPRGGKFVATWKLGKLVKGNYLFDDNLEFKQVTTHSLTHSIICQLIICVCHQVGWKYATDADRRFWTEVQQTINLSGIICINRRVLHVHVHVPFPHSNRMSQN
jgi:hypothetical protein